MAQSAPDTVTADPLQQGTSSATDKKDDTGTQQDSGKQDASSSSDDGEKDLAYWKQRSRENETKAKGNAAAAKELAEIKDKDKTEQQRTAEALASAEAARKTAETQLLRSQIGAAKGLPPEMVGRLTGDTQEEIEADADELIEQIGKVGGGAPVTDLKQGDRGAPKPVDDVDNWIRKAAGRN